MGDVIQFRKPEKRRQSVYYLHPMLMAHLLKGGKPGVFTVTPDGIATFKPEPEIDRWPDAGMNWVVIGAFGISLAIWAAIVTFAWSEFR